MELKSTENQYKLVIKEVNNLDKNKIYRLLEIGAGARLLKDHLPANIQYESLDFGEQHDFDFNLDNGSFPIKDNIYDIIVCTETLEHTFYPNRIIKEAKRVSKKEALFFFSLPNEYNFITRFYYLIGKKTEFDEVFLTTEKHLHIHKPRVKDIIDLFSIHFQINDIEYIWQSRQSMYSNTAKVIDKIINAFAQIWPSMFARCVSIKASNPKDLNTTIN